MVISNKYFDITAYPEAKWPCKPNGEMALQNIVIFDFLFHYLKKVMRPKIKISLMK